MALKDQVLTLLEQYKGSYLSGEEMAEQLGVSRNSVWKAIKQLQTEGHQITGVNRLGYTLDSRNNVLSAPGIQKYLKDPALQITVQSSVTSTNTLLKQAAENGAPEGTVLVAEEQTAGRGRLGRSFYSPAGTGVYFSLVLRPAFSAAESSLITTCAAVAAAGAMEEISGHPTQIKWVNDIYTAGRKVCGILTEAAIDMESGGLQYAVLGIGINLLKPENDFPEEYRRRSMLTGQEVEILRGGTVVPAKALGIDDDFGLIVEYPDGRQEHLGSGDVSVRKTQTK